MDLYSSGGVVLTGLSACRNVVVAGVRCAGRGRKTWRECVKDDMDELGLHSEWVYIVFRDMWRGLMTLAEQRKKWTIKSLFAWLG